MGRNYLYQPDVFNRKRGDMQAEAVVERYGSRITSGCDLYSSIS
jgi:hypothetical protein